MPIKESVRVNTQIRVPQVRVIDSEGAQAGIMERRAALELAQAQNFDLVEVSPNAKPPVCRIMDYGKYKYQQSKRIKDSRKNQHAVQVKEIRMRPKTDEHDYLFKVRHAMRFLEERNRVKISVMFRGREQAHREFGRSVLERAIADVSEIASAEGAIRIEGRNMVVTLVPK
ncbi:MAG: translation initiation factor IF-3 [Candidatus Latescibacterota bacterium]